MLDQGEIKLKLNNDNQTEEGIFKSALFLNVAKPEGLEYKVGAMEFSNTPSITPRTSEVNFKNFISSDLMRRLEESSPIKSHASFDLTRKFSELCLVNCENKNEENDDESGLNINNDPDAVIKLEKMNSEKKNFISKEEAGNRIIRGERKEKMGTESEHVLNATKNLKAKNFMLKTQILKPQNEYYITEEESEESSNNQFQSNYGPTLYDNQIARESNSLFENMMNFGNLNYSQNSMMSPTYKTKQLRSTTRKDSSPLYSYYNDTSEYLSHNFYDEFNKNFYADRSTPGDKNFINLDNTNNYIKKVTPVVINKFDEINNDKSNKPTYINNPKHMYDPTYNKFNLDNNNMHTNPNILNPNRLPTDVKNNNNNKNQMNPNINNSNNYMYNYNNNLMMNVENFNQNNSKTNNVKQFDTNKNFQINYQNIKPQAEDELEGENNDDHNQTSINYMNSNLSFPGNLPDQQMILNYMMNKDTQKKIPNNLKSNSVNTDSSAISYNNTTVTSEDDYIVEMFGRKGWICELCNNFNYETRMKCNRCGVNKSPKRNVKGKTAKNSNVEKTECNDSTSEDAQSSDRKKKKPFSERVGDWVCIKCKNLNFSFRILCNRCQLPKTESEKLFDNYMGNLMNYFKLNEMMQQQIFHNNNNQFPIQNQPGYVNTNSININNNYYNQYPNNVRGNNPGMKNVPLPNYFNNKNIGYNIAGGVNVSNYTGPKGNVGSVDGSVSNFDAGNKGGKKDFYEHEI